MPIVRSTPLVAALLALAASAAFAANPPGGTLSPSAPTLTFSSGPHFISNPEADCEASPCDDYALTVELPANYAQTNPNAKIAVALVYDVPGDLDLEFLDANGAELTSSGEPPGLPEYMEIAAGSGVRALTVRVVPFAVTGTSGTITISLVEPEPPPPPATPQGLPPRFQVHVPPPDLGNDAAEPSVGHNRHTQRAMFISSTQALRLSFPEYAAPAQPVACDATWEDKSGLLTTLNTLDPILYTDLETGRTFNSQLSGANSLFEFTDDDGDTWTAGQIGIPNGGADHQTVASGPYPAGFVPPNASWPATGDKRAVYYCSQSVAGAVCSRSDDGGLTFGPGYPFKNLECTAGALHGHVKVAPDGTVYVPDSSQCLLPVGGTAEKVVAFVSGDAGQTWAVRPLPESEGGAASDPSVGLATDGTAYMCYENGDGRVRAAVSDDVGRTWRHDQDIGAAAGIVYTRFPQAIAGDPDRAACAFLGTTTATGDPDSLDFEGVWHAYVATTYDGGASWHLVQVTTDDPIQGHGGVGPDGTNRNLLDFNDLQIDDTGRLLFALADGCVGGCARDPSKNSFAAKATLIRQVGGRTLYAAFDDDAGTQFNSSAALRPAPACALQSESLRTIAQANVVWNAPDDGGSTVTGYEVLRSTSAAGPFTPVGTTAGATEYVDRAVDPNVPEYHYRVVASNALGAAAAGNTIVLPISAAPPVVDTCTLPGDIIATDSTGDGTADDTDIVYLAVAEPPTHEGHFVVTLKLANFTSGAPPATSFYPILFPSEDNLYIALDATQAVPRFTHGTYADITNGALQFTEAGTLDARSGFDADGTVRLVVPKTLFDDASTGAILAGFDARARVGAQSATSRDTAGPADYTVRGTAVCSAAEPLLATLEASVKSGAPPLEVTYTVSGVPPTGRTLASWTLTFGDGEGVANQSFGGNASATVQHTYAEEGTFRARLTVTDDSGATSSNLAEQTIEVAEPLADVLLRDGFESP